VSGKLAITLRKLLNPSSLTTQLILSFILVVILTSVTVGLPAILLIRGQLDQQAWSQVDQGLRATESLYDAKQVEVNNLAVLTGRRPTLYELLKTNDQDALRLYLSALQVETGLNLIVVCDSLKDAIASTDQQLASDACKTWRTDGFRIVRNDAGELIWLSSIYALDTADVEAHEVIVGLKLDDQFADLLSAQTGLEQVLWAGGNVTATSLPGGHTEFQSLDRRQTPRSLDGRGVYNKFKLDGSPFYSAQVFLADSDIGAEVALDVSQILTTRTRLALALGGGILLVACIVSFLGVFLARRIGRPLVGLADAAGEFQRGDLETPVVVKAPVQEVEMVARALERARVDLKRTINHLQHEKAWSEHLLESIVEGIVTLDSQGRITYFSQGAEDILAMSREVVLNQLCDDVFHLVEAGSLFSQAIPAPGSRSKLILEVAGGKQITLSITQARLAPSEVSDADVVLVFRDVSEEDVVHRLLGNFLANVAHEFRTPLSSLAASIELLLDQASDLNADELQELLVSLHLGTLGLQTLVDNLLEGASIEAGRFRVSPRQTKLDRIIGEAVQMMRPLLEKYGQSLQVELIPDMPYVQADERRVVQVLVNLLSNAIKYGPSDGQVTIRVERSQEWVKISVADQGPGIPAELRTDIFRRFTYPRSLSDSAKFGVGLGLSVVKAVVEAHGGRVGVSDSPEGGAVFWFTLHVVNEE
jgi:two-component system phosphate regulon sensor histidine kinase PhoR